jgi:two-component system cell cycle sensor histidine kinase/response regulator CckA
MALPRNRETRKTVLLVDDFADVLTLVRTILEDAGFEVLPASSAKQAICIEAQFLRTIHLLLSDDMMPDMCGPDLASALKKRRPEMQVMLMSGYTNSSSIGPNHRWRFLRKPFLPTALLAGVTDVLSTTVEPAVETE